jgi:preprotein translocase subunit Sss1
MTTISTSIWSRMAPALLLMLLAPVMAEVLPGATRLSAIFVLPIQIFVWGGGALMIRYAVKRWRLGWANMLLLALVLSIAEECLIQQTSLAPMVLYIKGEVYARAFGVNYVYFLWALAYETVFVVFLPAILVELLYPQRRDEVWLSRAGLAIVMVFFVIGCGLAWYSWTQTARPYVFHVPIYNPPIEAVLIAIAAIGGLLYAALGPWRAKIATPAAALQPPSTWSVAGCGFVWAVLWYGLVLLGFGIEPTFPPAIAVTAGLAMLAAILWRLPRWTAHPAWQANYNYALVFGTLTGAMLVGFIGFIVSTTPDLYFKIAVNIIAVVLMIQLGLRIKLRGNHFPVSSSGLRA